jgi:Tfp pilus assembly protein PilO
MMKPSAVFQALSARLEPRHKLLLGGAAALVVMVWLVRFLYLPVLAAIGERRAILQDLQVKLADAAVLTERLPQQEADLRGARARYAELEERVGSGQSLGRVLESLGQEAKRHRLELLSVKPKEEATARRTSIGPDLVLREHPLTLRLDGRYQQFGEFLGGLSTAPFLASVRALSLAKTQPESTQLRADLVLAVHLAEESAAP